MENLVDKKTMLYIGKILQNPKFSKGFMIAIMTQEDYMLLKNLYKKLDDTDREIEENLSNLIQASKIKESAAVYQKGSLESFNLFNSLIAFVYRDAIGKSLLSVEEYENRLCVLRQQRDAIINEIDELYNSYVEKYNQKINCKETKKFLVSVFGKNNKNMERNFIEWVMGL